MRSETWRRLEVLDDGDVGLRERVERSNDRLEDGDGLAQLLIAVVFDRLRGLSLLVRYRLIRLHNFLHLRHLDRLLLHHHHDFVHLSTTEQQPSSADRRDASDVITA